MAYKDSLKPWAVVRLGKNLQWIITALRQAQGTPITNRVPMPRDIYCYCVSVSPILNLRLSSIYLITGNKGYAA